VVERLREAAPHEPHSNAVRGWCLYRLGRFTESVACYRRALDALDRPCGVQFDLGLTLLGLGRTEEARSTDESALTGLRGLPRPRQQGVLSVASCDLHAVAEREPALRDAALHFLRLLGADPGQPGAAERA
jgi:tetratricopeptide (TPR) repeat protein